MSDETIYGEWNVARNYAADMEGTIHDEELAKKVGQRGGMVVGWTYMDLFPKLLLESFGQEWFERGTLSIYFTYALMDGEKVRAGMEKPPADAEGAQVNIRAETPEGKTVCKGTACIGEPREPSYVRAIDLDGIVRDDIRVLYDIHAGDPMETMDVTIAPEMVNGRIAHILEPMEWSRGDSPWGGPIVPLSLCYEALRGEDPNVQIGVVERRAAGFLGAEEVRFVSGPIKVGVPYVTGGKYLAVGSSPKTEFFWYDSWLDDKATGKRVAEMRQMWRYFKASAAAWQEG